MPVSRALSGQTSGHNTHVAAPAPVTVLGIMPIWRLNPRLWGWAFLHLTDTSALPLGCGGQPLISNTTLFMSFLMLPNDSFRSALFISHVEHWMCGICTSYDNDILRHSYTLKALFNMLYLSIRVTLYEYNCSRTYFASHFACFNIFSMLEICPLVSFRSFSLHSISHLRTGSDKPNKSWQTRLKEQTNKKQSR